MPGAASAAGRFGGFGCRRGLGGGMRGVGMQARNRFMAQQYGEVGAATATEKELLSRQMNALETQLQQVKQRLEQLSSTQE
jgi:nitrate/nitrite transporter NarK